MAESIVRLPRKLLETHDGSEIRHAAGHQEPKDLAEGFLIVGEIREVGDAPVVGGNLDDIGGEAAGAAGVEEGYRGLAANEPTCCVVGGGSVFYRELETVEGSGEVDEAVLPEGEDPFAVIGEGSVDAAVALGGAGDTLVRGDGCTGTVFGVAHRAVKDGLAFHVDGRVVHVEGEEDVIFYKAGVGLVGSALDDEGQQAEAGVAVAEAGTRREIG